MMKKRICLLITVLAVMLCILSACSGMTKEYTCKELTMEVPLTVVDQDETAEEEGFTFALSNSDIAIFGLKETFDELGVDNSFTVTDYANAVIDANGIDATAISRSTADYDYFRYTASGDDGSTIKYLAAVYKSDDAFWMVQVAAKLANYEEEDFFDYLDSVEFD